MGEIVNAPNNYHESDILNKISLPENDHLTQKNLDETRKLQKSVSNLEDSEEKKKKRKNDQIQKDK